MLQHCSCKHMLLQARKIYCVQRAWHMSSGRWLNVSCTLKTSFSLEIFSTTHCLHLGAHCCMVCCEMNSIFTNVLLSLQKYFRRHTLSATIYKKTPVKQKYKAGHNWAYAGSWWSSLFVYGRYRFTGGRKSSLCPPCYCCSMSTCTWLCNGEATFYLGCT